MGVALASGVDVAVGVGAGVVTSEVGVSLASVPPPTPNDPVCGWWTATAPAAAGGGFVAPVQAMVRRRTAPTADQPMNRVPLSLEVRNGARDRRFQALVIRRTVSKTASPNTARLGRVRPWVSHTAMARYPMVATTYFQGVPDRNPGTPQVLSLVNTAASDGYTNACPSPLLDYQPVRVLAWGQ